MTSKDDDTLPLAGLSLELSVDATVDEDFIPTSQPQSDGNSKVSKNSGISSHKLSDEKESRGTSSTEIDDTLPTDSTMECTVEKSADFIPDTETKHREENFSREEVKCKKKLPMFETQDIFETRPVPQWDEEVSKIPESPPEEPARGSLKKGEDSIPEILVNDSAETVDLDATGNSCPKPEKPGFSSFSSESGRNEDTRIFDHSVLLLDRPMKSEKSQEDGNTQNLYLEETIEDEFSLKEKANGSLPGMSLPILTKLSKELDKSEDGDGNVEEVAQRDRLPPFEEERRPVNSTPRTSLGDPDAFAAETREIDLKLSVTCKVTFDVKTKKVLRKCISSVDELPKHKPKPAFIEHVSDNASDKSKRYSTSSSGSVYSEKFGLPLPPSKRMSAYSDQTDSSDEGFSKTLLAGKKILERLPWSNEYLLPLKMDEIIKTAIENQDFKNRRSLRPSPRKVPTENCNGLSRWESPSSELTDTSHVDIKGATSEDVPEKERPASPTLDKIPEEDPESAEKEKPRKEEEPGDAGVEIRDGLAVFARWTDKRYYSGVLAGSPKNERWDILFDDGTSKTVKEDFVLPAKWLKVGALVFALVGDKYESGQIVGVHSGDEVSYAIELDTEKKEVIVKRCDLCLTDVMAGIIRENFKPLSTTPRGKVNSDIDFDNVVTGKRLREQRTPSRPISAQSGSSGLKKPSTKGKKRNAGTPSEAGEPTAKRTGGLQAENGHLVEDKIISTDSPSGNEAGETPQRGAAKETRGKTKPRSLSYEAEEVAQNKSKGKKNWLAPDGTPIPGPSGLKFKRQKTKPTFGSGDPEQSDETETLVPDAKKSNPPSGENGRRKRKLDEPVDEEIQKKPSKEAAAARKTRSRKG